MKKNLQNAMAKNFQKMVNEQPLQETSTKEPEKKESKKQKNVEIDEVIEETIDETPVIDYIPETEPVVLEPVPVAEPITNTNISNEPVSNPSIAPQIHQQPIVQQVTSPISEVVPQPTVQPQLQPQMQVQVQPQTIPVQQVMPTPVYVSEPMITPVTHPVYREQYVSTPVNTIPEEKPVTSRSSGKKTIPLVPDEKSSGVLHIRLGELRSYVDFMTQSTKMSYQQYISNLIEQDYEKNKDLYLKYKSFMEQLNM